MTDAAKKLELADAEVARLSNIITIQQKQIERLIECRDAAQTYQKQIAERDQTIRALQDRIRQLEDELVN